MSSARILVLKDRSPGERRVAATPETVEKLQRNGCQVVVEAGAGAGAYLADEAFDAAGATIAKSAAEVAGEMELLVSVAPPSPDDSVISDLLPRLKEGAIYLAAYAPTDHLALVKTLAAHRVTSFSMMLVPRITRAQKMDALSSQANIAGYKAALLAASALPKYFPLLMTAAGTVKPAKVVVMGAGVAGLQAIATARRLGAVVWATDVRLAAKEQVESLGAKFIDVPGMADLEGAGGYAKEAPEAFLRRQQEIVAEHIAEADAVITTALVPGRPAPRLVPSDLLRRMRAGSVLVDLAAGTGGNCEETVAGETVVRHGVTIMGPLNLPSTLPVHASELYARNVLAFLLPLLPEGALRLDLEDEILAASLVTHGGTVHHAATAAALSAGASR